MSDVLVPNPPGLVRGRPFEKGRSGNPTGRRLGSRNKATLAAAALLAGESEALTRTAVELAQKVADMFADDPDAFPEDIARGVFAILERHVSPGEIGDVKHVLPAGIRALMP